MTSTAAGSLTHLVAGGAQQVISVDYNSASDGGAVYTDGKFKEPLYRSGDYAIPVALRIECINALLPFTIKSISFTTESGRTFLQIPFTLFEAMGKLTVTGNVKVYSFNFEIFLPPIPLVSITRENIVMQVAVENNANIRRLNFVYKSNYLAGSEREQRRNNHRSLTTQLIQSRVFTNTHNLTKMCMDFVGFYGNSKGFILEGPIDTITKLEFYLSNHCRFNYTPDIFHLVTHRINTNLLYVPFSPINANRLNTSIELDSHLGVSGFLNYSRISNVKMHLETSEPAAFTVHSLIQEKFEITSNQLVLPSIRFQLEPRNASAAEDSPVRPPLSESPHEMWSQADNFALTTIRGLLNEAGLRPSGTYVTENGIVHDLSGAQMSQDNTWRHTSRPIDPERAICAIEQSEIAANATYCHCISCNNNFSAPALQNYFRHQEITGGQKRCPTCRTSWTNWVVYTNSERQTSGSERLSPRIDDSDDDRVDTPPPPAARNTPRGTVYGSTNGVRWSIRSTSEEASSNV